GSVTDRVLHSSDIPVLAITPEMAKRYGEGRMTLTKIVVPLDGSAIAEQALPYVEELAKKMSLEVIVARTINEFPGYTPYSAELRYKNDEPVMLDIEAEAVEYLKGIVKRLRASGLVARSALYRGGPAPNIIQLARDTEENMIAITTHGRSGIKRLMLGSVAEAVVRGAGDPVLVIPPNETD
ncbi:MAG: universal stress protein, partial [SAR202 cluster bacterium]|nr:universal stress protein [SAR202 cluster bacterium]